MLGLCRLVLLLSLGLAVSAAAGPVTGTAPVPATTDASATTSSDESASSEEPSAIAASTLFDGVGLPLLRLSAPIYLSLGEHPKLRARGSEGIEEDFGMGNVSVSPGISLTTGLVIPGPFGDALGHPLAVPEPSSLWLLLPAIAVVHRRIRARFSRT